MLRLVPQSTSWAARLAGVIGFDTRPYRWSVFGDAETRLGEFTAEYLARGASLELNGERYRMQRRGAGLLRSSFTIITASGEQRAGASRRARGIVARETTVQIDGETFTLSGDRERHVLLTRDNRVAGTVVIERDGWTVRQCRGTLDFTDGGIGEAVRVFLFWLSIHQDLNRGDGGG